MKRFTSILTEDSDGIKRNIPNTRFWKWEINELGFRGKAIELKKKEGQIRIVCLGGSETFGYYESKDKEWPAQLGKMIQDKFPRTEVINASVAGLQTNHRKDYVKQYILPLKPDMLIFYQHRFMIFIREQMRGIPAAKRAKTKKKTRRNPVGLLDAYMRYIFNNEAGVRHVPRWLPKHIAMLNVRRKIKKREKKFLANKEPLDEAPKHLVLSYEKELISFCDYLKENNIIPILSTFPFLITASNKSDYLYELLTIRRYCVELSENGILDGIKKLNKIIKNIAEKQHMVFIDNDLVIPKTKRYFVDHVHYTNKGSEIIARNFYHILEHSGLLR